jgi:cytidylate kinase
MIVYLVGMPGSGKSTIAAAVSRRLSVPHIDTGAMYRALALKVLRSRVPPEDEPAVTALIGATDISVGDGSVLLDGEEVKGLIRSPEVTAASSKVAQHGAVRRWMVERQRAVVQAAPEGAVVEGRDIGTVVLPDADLKVYLTASEQERARRRAAQRGASAEDALSEVATRDSRDMQRAHSPLRPAEDAVVLDTTGLSVDQVVEAVLERLREALAP